MLAKLTVLNGDGLVAQWQIQWLANVDQVFGRGQALVRVRRLPNEFAAEVNVGATGLGGDAQAAEGGDELESFGGVAAGLQGKLYLQVSIVLSFEGEVELLPRLELEVLVRRGAGFDVAEPDFGARGHGIEEQQRELAWFSRGLGPGVNFGYAGAAIATIDDGDEFGGAIITRAIFGGDHGAEGIGELEHAAADATARIGVKALRGVGVADFQGEQVTAFLLADVRDSKVIGDEEASDYFHAFGVGHFGVVLIDAALRDEFALDLFIDLRAGEDGVARAELLLDGDADIAFSSAVNARAFDGEQDKAGLIFGADGIYQAKEEERG